MEDSHTSCVSDFEKYKMIKTDGFFEKAVRFLSIQKTMENLHKRRNREELETIPLRPMLSIKVKGRREGQENVKECHICNLCHFLNSKGLINRANKSDKRVTKLYRCVTSYV